MIVQIRTTEPDLVEQVDLDAVRTALESAGFFVAEVVVVPIPED